MTVIEVRDLSVRLGGREVLKKIDFESRESLILLIGPNGSGKTTLLKTLAGLIDGYRGVIRINGRDIRELRRRDIARLVGFVWQNPYYGFIEPRVYDEIMLITRILGEEKIDREIIDSLVDPELFHRDPFTLSGGEAKRVSLASVLIIDQPIWLLDEPFEYLDLSGVELLSDIIQRRRSSKIIIVSSTNIAYLKILRPDKIMILHRGEIKYFGEIKSFEDEYLERAGIISRRMICW
ncbi:MAG: ABC transporter ATP-binding protein [Sulfolobales archaeon]